MGLEFVSAGPLAARYPISGLAGTRFSRVPVDPLPRAAESSGVHLQQVPRDSVGSDQAGAIAARCRTPWVVRVGVGMLVLASCLAVATVAAWLVVPYAALMAWLLLSPLRGDGQPAPVRQPASSRPIEVQLLAEALETPAHKALPEQPDRPNEATDPASSCEPAESLSRAAVAEAMPTPKLTRAGEGETGLDTPHSAPRRGRGSGRRGRRAGRATASPEPVSVTWVQVGPGKFIRVEAPAPAAPSHADDPAVSRPGDESHPEPQAAAVGSSIVGDPNAAAETAAALSDPNRTADSLTPSAVAGTAVADPTRPEPIAAADDEPVDVLTDADTDIPQASADLPIDSADIPGGPSTPPRDVSESVNPESAPAFDAESSFGFVLGGRARTGRRMGFGGRVTRRRERRVARRLYLRRPVRRLPVGVGRPSPRQAPRRPQRRAHGRHSPRGPPRLDLGSGRAGRGDDAKSVSILRPRHPRTGSPLMTRLPLVSLLLLRLAVAAPAQEALALFPRGYDHHEALTAAIERLAQNWPATIRVVALGRSAEGREIPMIRLGRDEPPAAFPRPAIVIVANLEADHLVGSQVALRMVERLADADGDEAAVTELIDRVTLYVVPRLNPDGAERLLSGSVRLDHRGSLRPLDHDRDGRADEDGPDDLDGDGLSLLMRVRDEFATWVPDDQDPRLLRKADPAKGEKPVYSVYREGLDNDGDGLIDEDPPGGVELQRNWPYRWSEFDPTAGYSPGAEPETRPLIRFLVERPEVVAVWTFGLADNLSAEPKKPDSPLHEADIPYFAELVRRHQQHTAEAAKAPGQPLAAPEPAFPAPMPVPVPPAPVRTRPGSASTALPTLDPATDGALHDWAYQQRGLIGLAARLWSRPEIPDPAEGEPKPPDDPEARWLYWNDRVAGGAAFVPFRAFDHPTLGPVELGGWRPGVRLNPPAERFAPIADAQLAFLKDLVDRLPRLELRRVEARPFGDGLFELEAVVANAGVLPTALAQGVRTREAPPVVVRLQTQGAQVVTGKVLHRLDAISSAQPVTLRWTIRAAEDVRSVDLEITCPRVGQIRRAVPLR
ncbi:MAG: hypothetical protein KatS3mg108_2223 [Isosphaeraceae bacterium]|nr:MAG: hypothetical protein KatS3mg108_2223 [Isosphaeraceae bacterium]